MSRRIRITAGDVSAEATLNDSKMADLIWEACPIKSSAKVWGCLLYTSHSFEPFRPFLDVIAFIRSVISLPLAAVCRCRETIYPFVVRRTRGRSGALRAPVGGIAAHGVCLRLRGAYRAPQSGARPAATGVASARTPRVSAAVSYTHLDVYKRQILPF